MRKPYVPRKSTLHERLYFHSVIMPSGCREWQSHKSKGYGRLTYKNQFKLAHREMWLAERGPIPDGMLVCHTCDNPACVNIDHLFLGTHQDNANDMVRKGRWKTGVPALGYKNHGAKITPEILAEIRAPGAVGAHIARKYGLHEETVRRAKNGATWGPPADHPR